ncbi:hypothetical protein BAUCODRAFT_218587 [Baudoinia panamericana UAMH 10762]|uniref:Uncharacterized protein n=1 Tax=Baudoinia panamericana (strain UAMH 10762) TaxID=717646 RepID=M2N5K5_BAUPA|nr:uncharacterized protein BAUCODRAFT_218587 [Baudoinia panamericana UAMH 10762]EMC94030.1 hypothetical protein BAUCODRAFT_218587 [Baudoinia panamericana UAMH 10762]
MHFDAVIHRVPQLAAHAIQSFQRRDAVRRAPQNVARRSSSGHHDNHIDCDAGLRSTGRFAADSLSVRSAPSQHASNRSHSHADRQNMRLIRLTSAMMLRIPQHELRESPFASSHAGTGEVLDKQQ